MKEYHYYITLNGFNVVASITRRNGNVPGDFITGETFSACSIFGKEYMTPKSLDAAFSRANKWALAIIKVLENGERL